MAYGHCRAVVVAQLVERSLPLPEVHGSNPVIGKPLYRTFNFCQLHRKDENEAKEAGNGPFFKIVTVSHDCQKSFELLVPDCQVPLDGYPPPDSGGDGDDGTAAEDVRV